MVFRSLPVGRLRHRSRHGRRDLLLDGIEPVVDLVEIVDEPVIAAGRTEHDSEKDHDGDPSPVLKPRLLGGSVDFVLYLAVAEHTFQGNELPLLERPGELGEIFPGIDPMPFGAVFVVALVVLPAFLGSDAEEDVLEAVRNFVPV
jgi:hypothetical protein